MSKVPKRPDPLEPGYVYVRKIFENLDEARATMRRALDPTYLKYPSDAIWYRDALDKLIRLEAQADALTYIFQKPQDEIRKWLDETLDYIKALEKEHRERT